MNKYQLVCSIVVYKSDINQLNKAINSFLNTKLLVKLIIIDNSPDPNIEKLLIEDPRIKYIFNNANLGYGSAHNIGIHSYIDNTEYYLVLNPDVYFEPNVLEALYDFMNKNKDASLVMPKVLYPNGETQYLCKLLPSPLIWFLRMFLPNWSYTERQNKLFEFRFTDYDSIQEVPYLSGCFMFMRSESLSKVGFFDENIFMHTEDADLSRRISINYKNYYYPLVEIYHEFQKDSHKSFKMFIIHIKSTIYYFNKWGWFFDKYRKMTNKRILTEFHKNN